MKLIISAFASVLTLFLSFSIVSAGPGRTPSKQPPAKQNKPPTLNGEPPVIIDPFARLDPNLPLMTQIIQKDFLVHPEDFEKNEDVKYIMRAMHRPLIIEKFYNSAARVYEDLPKMYREIQEGEETARGFLDIMKRLTQASLHEPLNITNIVYAFTRHLRPLFETASPPIEELDRLLLIMENSREGLDVSIMTRFFRCFTLREITTLQDFIKLMSLASLTSEATKETSDLDLLPDRKNPLFSRVQQRKFTGKLDIRRTGMSLYGERARLIIANAVAKMIILMDLFVNDPTIAMRAIEIFRHLWELHLRRMSAREGIPDGEFDPVWFNPVLYRKLPINFSFDDWSPGSISPEAMTALSNAAEQERRQRERQIAIYKQRAIDQKNSQMYQKISWVALTVIALAVLAFTAFYLYRTNHKRLVDGENALDKGAVPADEIVVGSEPRLPDDILSY